MKPVSSAPEYFLLESKDELQAVLQEAAEAGSLIFDLETTSLKRKSAKILGIALSYSLDRAYYYPVVYPGDLEAYHSAWAEVKPILQPVFGSPEIALHGHNVLEFDAQVLYWQGVRCRGLQDDTRVMFRYLDSEFFSAGLDPLCLRYFNFVKVETQEVFKFGKRGFNYAEVNLDELAYYACEDADYTFKLRQALEEEIRRLGQWDNYLVTRQMTQVLFDMYVAGLRVDINTLDKMEAQLAEKLEAIKNRITEIAGEEFNPNSAAQKAELLYNKFRLHKKAKIKVPATPKGQMQVTSAILQELADKTGEELPKLLVEYSKLNKLFSTYAVGYRQHIVWHSGIPKIHATLSMTNVSTGRLSCSEPNLQNAVRPNPDNKDEPQIRQIFIASDPEKYVLVDADFSQIELRVIAHYCGDPTMVQCFKEDKDIHTMMACEVFHTEKPDKAQRTRVKVLNFGLVYGMQAGRFAKTVNVSYKEAEQFIDNYFGRFPGMKNYLKNVVNYAKDRGFVQNMYGRRRFVPLVDIPQPERRQHDINRATNHPIQSSVADLMYRVMVKVHKAFEDKQFDGALLLQVHDEILCEVARNQVSEFIDWLRETMEGAAKLEVPIKADISTGETWYEAH